jgi:hypothetical protein
MITPFPAIVRAASRPASPGVVTRVEMKDLPGLARRLAAYESVDPYAVSAAYYGFTGRHGLWTYEEDGDVIPFCLHPNVPGTMLVFPSASPRGLKLAEGLLRNYLLPEGRVQLSRLLPETAAEAAARLPWAAKGRRYAVVDEPVLDWLFPVHTLSTSLVVAREGGAFEKFRNRLNRVDMSRITVDALDIGAHYDELMDLCRRWANDRARGNFSFDDLFEPHAAIVRLVRDSALDLKGTVIRMEGTCVGFGVWEMPSGPAGAASSVAFLAHGPSKGLPELLQLEMCRALEKDGVARACIGGSETEGLDTYKKKLQPVESLSLVTVEVTPDPAVVLPDTVRA